MSHSIRRAALALALAAASASLSFPLFAADAPEQATVGAWSPAPLNDDAVKRAAQFALTAQAQQARSQLTLLAIKHARRQAAAGTNYSMNLMVQTEGKRRLVIAEVWAKLDGTLQLTRWHWV